MARLIFINFTPMNHADISRWRVARENFGIWNGHQLTPSSFFWTKWAWGYVHFVPYGSWAIHPSRRKLQGFRSTIFTWFWYDFAADLCCFWTNSCVSNFFHQLQRSENPSFELLSMSKLRVLSIDEKFPANPKTSFRRILEEYEAICSKYRFEVHL